MKIQTLNHSLEVKGLEFDCHSFGGGSLASFETLTIDGVISFTYEDLKEYSLKNAKEIWQALENAANDLANEWQKDSVELRAWMTYRRG